MIALPDDFSCGQHLLSRSTGSWGVLGAFIWSPSDGEFSIEEEDQ